MPAGPEPHANRAAAPSSEQLSAVDRLQLRAISDRYATAVDARDLVGLRACFFEDALLQMRSSNTTTQEFRGHSGLAEIFELLRPLLLTMHSVTTWSLDPGPEPSAIVYCCAHHISRRDEGESDLVMYIRYDDRYGRDRDRSWRLRERVATVLFTERRPVRLAST